jgi:hypothetical protein
LCDNQRPKLDIIIYTPPAPYTHTHTYSIFPFVWYYAVDSSKISGMGIPATPSRLVHGPLREIQKILRALP